MRISIQSLRHFLLTCLLLWIGGVALAQKQQISVAGDIRLDPQNQTGNTFIEKDANGNKMALIIVRNVPLQGTLSFETNNREIRPLSEKKKESGSDLPCRWVYIESGAKYLTISHSDPNIMPLKNFNISTERIKGPNTYILTLETIETGSNTQKQYFEFVVHPENATVKVGDSYWNVRNGRAEKLLTYGAYQYNVSLPNYHAEVGEFVVNSSQKQSKEIFLKPNFGWLKVDGGDLLEDASLYVDGANLGSANRVTDILKSGEHQVVISKPMYRDFSQTVTISDNDTLTLRPVLVPNFAVTTLTVANGDDAEIWIDGTRKGNRQVQLPLERGTYFVETRKDKHRTRRQEIRIENVDMDNEFTLAAPTPICGSLNVECNVHGAKVRIDGKEVGVASLHIPDLLIGQYEVEVSQPDYETKTQTVIIEEGNESTLEFQLNTVCNVLIDSKPSGVMLRMDGKEVGVTPFNYEGVVGDFRLQLSRYGYLNYDQRHHVSNAERRMMLEMKRTYLAKKEIYVDAGGAIGVHTGAAFAFGAYIQNFNLQADVTSAFGPESETIYWTKLDASKVEERQYKPALCFGGRVGYGFMYGAQFRFRLTPQVGAFVTNLNNNGGYAVSGLGAVRLHYAIAPHVALMLTPEFLFRFSASDEYQALADVSSKINGYSQGVNVKAGLSIFF